MKINPAGLDLIKRFEGFRPEPYKCSAGVWTIGYGSTRDAQGDAITLNHPPIDEATAEAYLMKHIVRIEGQLADCVTIGVNDNQFSALVSLAYNIGVSALCRSQTLRCLNKGNFDDMADEWREWRKAGGKVLAGLERRREAELQLFNTKG